jgi:hypothetical protein
MISQLAEWAGDQHLHPPAPLLQKKATNHQSRPSLVSPRPLCRAPVQQHPRRPVPLEEVFAVHHANGDAGAVGGGGPQALRGVVIFREAAQDGLDLKGWVGVGGGAMDSFSNFSTS